VTKWLLLGFGAYYMYNQMQSKLNAAMADRAALLNMLTPDQRATLASGIQAAASAATQVAATTAQLISSASAPAASVVSTNPAVSGGSVAPVAHPLSGVSYYPRGA
jgi:hypothetical protein